MCKGGEIAQCPYQKYPVQQKLVAGGVCPATRMWSDGERVHCQQKCHAGKSAYKNSVPIPILDALQ